MSQAITTRCHRRQRRSGYDPKRSRSRIPPCARGRARVLHRPVEIRYRWAAVLMRPVHGFGHRSRAQAVGRNVASALCNVRYAWGCTPEPPRFTMRPTAKHIRSTVAWMMRRSDQNLKRIQENRYRSPRAPDTRPVPAILPAGRRPRARRSRRAVARIAGTSASTGDPDPEPEPPGNPRCLPAEVAP